MTVQLVRLDCVSCGSALRGQARDILFLCEHCGSGAVLEPAGLRPVSSSGLVPRPGRKVDLWLPGWLVEADVEVSQRFRADGMRTPDVASRRTFVIPGFELPLSELTALAARLSGAAEGVEEAPRDGVRGGTLSLEDALTLCRHLVVGEEARRPDMLASVQVTVSSRSAGIVALPFGREDGRLVCAVTGLKLRQG